jgi:hypothetical protein
MVGGLVAVNPLAATVALLIWGWMWVLAIPIVAGAKAVCDNVPPWKPYGKLLGTSSLPDPSLYPPIPEVLRADRSALLGETDKSD